MKYFILLALPLAACSTLGTGIDVHQIGKDSYTTRALDAKSSTEAKQKALHTAESYCKGQNRYMMLVEEYSGQEESGAQYDDVTFLCVPEQDPDFQRLKTSPTKH